MFVSTNERWNFFAEILFLLRLSSNILIGITISILFTHSPSFRSRFWIKVLTHYSEYFFEKETVNKEAHILHTMVYALAYKYSIQTTTIAKFSGITNTTSFGDTPLAFNQKNFRTWFASWPLTTVFWAYF